MKSYEVTVNGKVYHVQVRECSGVPAAAMQKLEAQPQNIAKADSVMLQKPFVSTKTEAPKAAFAPVPTGGAVTVCAPMPGSIMEVKVSKGESVSKNQLLCVLEAMKMENDINSPAQGTVTEVHVSKGQSVDTGALMFAIELS